MEVSCDILTGENLYALFVRFIDTSQNRISSFNSHKTPEKRAIVTHVIFYRGILPTFPSELSDLFSNLRCVDIFDCGMMEITKADLKNFPNLEKLKLEANQLRFLPGDLFEFNPKVATLSFLDNQIDGIGGQLVDNLPNLIEADFKGNVSINFKYSKELNSIEELKRIIKRDCRPLKSLQNIVIKVLIATRERQDLEKVRFLADRLNLRDLKERI